MIGVNVPDAVVIDDLGDADFGGSIDGLPEFVVIDQGNAGGTGGENITFGEDAAETEFASLAGLSQRIALNLGNLVAMTDL